mgnify:CR=1 FL=1
MHKKIYLRLFLIFLFCAISNAKAEITNVSLEQLSVADGLSQGTVNTIFQDKQQNYWLGSYDKGIHLLSKTLNYIGSLKKQNKYHLSIDANALFDMKIIDNHYWLATDNGLYIVDDRYQLISHLTANNKQENNSQTLLSNNIRAIAQFDENHVWLATHNGLNTINLLNNHIESYQTNTKSTSLNENWLMDIYRDNNNNMWLASYGGGVNKYSPLRAFVYHGLENDDSQSYWVESFAESSDGTIWLSTEQNGLFSLSKSKVLTKIQLNLNENIWQVISANNNQLLLRTESGKLYQYNLQKNIISEHKKWPDESNHPAGNFILATDESLWYINGDGFLTRYKTELCDRSIALNKMTKQLSEKNESYERLYKAFVELQNKQTLLQQNSKIIEFVDALVARFECFKAKISASRGMRMSLFMSALKMFFSKWKQGADSGVEKVFPVNKWLPTTKAMPAFKGMYRVSDGQHSALSYFNSASHEFANQGFHIKYWQLIG